MHWLISIGVAMLVMPVEYGTKNEQLIPPSHIVAIAAATSRSQITLHEPAFVDIGIKNLSVNAVQIDLGTDRKDAFIVLVRSPTGMLLSREYRWPTIDVAGGVGRIIVDPSDTYSQHLLLNEWYDFPEAGRYEITLQVRSQIVSMGGSSLQTLQTAPISLEVLPYSPSVLERECKAFARLALRAGVYQAAADAARALSYVIDPIAVPHLAEVLAQTRTHDAVVIAGLVRIGNRDAMQVLEASAQSDDESRSALARDALRRFVLRRE